MTASGRPAVTASGQGDLPARNRWTAAALVGWIVVLAAASLVVAWLRN